MDLGERDIWNEDEAVRDAAVRAFLAGELYWSSTSWDSDPHGPGWLSTQYRHAPSPEAQELLVSSVLKSLEDPAPLVRAACLEFFICSSAESNQALVSVMKNRRDLFKQTPYPFREDVNNAFAALTSLVAGQLSAHRDDETLKILREEIDCAPENSSLVAIMAFPDTDREWMLSQAPRLLAERPELVTAYLRSSYEQSDRMEFLNAIRDVLAPEVLRAEIQSAIPNAEKASFYLNELGL